MWTFVAFVKTVIDDTIAKFKAEEEHWLGMVIVYDDKVNLPEISDAQHRLTTLFLIICALSELLEDTAPLKRISRYGDDDIYNDEISYADEETMTRYSWTRMPHIQSVYVQDFVALGNILNRCQPDDASESAIYAVYGSLKPYVQELLPTAKEKKLFLQFIDKHVLITFLTTTSWSFSIEMFSNINNIKVAVPPTFLLKNAIVKRIGKARSHDVHDMLEGWRRICMDEGKDFDKTMHHVFDQFIQCITSQEEYTKDVSSLFEKRVCSGCPLEEFRQTYMKYMEAYRRIQSDPFGSILQKMASGYEIMEHLLVPHFFYSTDTTILRLLVAYAIRTEKSSISFNSLAFSNRLTGPGGLTAKLMSGVPINLDALRATCRDWLKKVKKVGESTEEYITRLATTKYTGSMWPKVRGMLLYIAELTDQHESRIDHSIIDIDHISPQKPKNAVPIESVNMLGNLTPIIGKNSKSGLKGNRSLSNKPYAEKIASYKASNIAMTRDVGNNMVDASDATIAVRSLELAKILEQLTRSELCL